MSSKLHVHNLADTTSQDRQSCSCQSSLFKMMSVKAQPVWHLRGVNALSPIDDTGAFCLSIAHGLAMWSWK